MGRLNESDVLKAKKLAIQMREKAYAPYSQFLVGAAFKLKKSDQFVGGHNIENASYGATMCAERSALFSAHSQFGAQDFEFIVIVADTNPVTVPCGLCLQVLSEFCDSDMPVILFNLQDQRLDLTLSDLLPYRFDTLKS